MITKKDLEGIAERNVVEIVYKIGFSNDANGRRKDLINTEMFYFLEYVPEENAIRVTSKFNQDGHCYDNLLFLEDINQIKKYIPFK